MKFSFSILAVIVSVCFTVNAGNKQDDEKLFDKVLSRLDKGGSYLNFQSNKYLFQAIENSYLKVPEVIKVVAPDPQQQNTSHAGIQLPETNREKPWNQ